MRIAIAFVCAVAALSIGSGCQAVAWFAAGAENDRFGTSDVPAEYYGLDGKTYAVVVGQDRLIQADFPTLAPELTRQIDNKIATGAAAAGHVPSADVTAFLNNTPAWPAWPRKRLADELGVDRLVVVELNDYRLFEVGNQFVWDGLAAATVYVYEADGFNPERAVLQKDFRITFPDGSGYTTDEAFQANEIASVLASRLSNRVSWLFFDHEEPNAIQY